MQKLQSGGLVKGSPARSQAVSSELAAMREARERAARIADEVIDAVTSRIVSKLRRDVHANEAQPGFEPVTHKVVVQRSRHTQSL